MIVIRGIFWLIILFIITFIVCKPANCGDENEPLLEVNTIKSTKTRYIRIKIVCIEGYKYLSFNQGESGLTLTQMFRQELTLQGVGVVSIPIKCNE